MKPLNKLSVVIPARNEEAAIVSTVRDLSRALKDAGIVHEILVVDDGSTDGTLNLVRTEAVRLDELVALRNSQPHGFGRAIQVGLNAMSGDAVVLFMADNSDSPADVVCYWKKLQEGYDCVFGSRFIKGGSTIDYPWHKLLVNRLANFFVRLLFRHGLNDTTNAFKAYRREVIEGVRPILSPHFNITVELPLKAIIRGYTWSVVPISWTNRRHGVSKLYIKEMGSRYLFIVLYVWLEKYFSKGDYHRVS